MKNTLGSMSSEPFIRKSSSNFCRRERTKKKQQKTTSISLMAKTKQVMYYTVSRHLGVKHFKVFSGLSILKTTYLEIHNVSN